MKTKLKKKKKKKTNQITLVRAQSSEITQSHYIYINNLETVPVCVTLQTKLQKPQSPNLAQECYIASG